VADNNPASNEPGPQARPPAGAAGVSGGTLLVLLAQNLPDDNPAKSWLLILAPSATLAVAYVWARLRFALDDYLAQRSARSTFSQARTTLHEILNDPRTTEDHKTDVRKELKQLERDYINSTTARFRARLKDHGRFREEK
jgi:hypothetical protein